MCATSAAAESQAHLFYHQIRTDVTCSRFLERSVCHFPELTRQNRRTGSRPRVGHSRCAETLYCELYVCSIWCFHFLFTRKPTPAGPLFAFKGSETFLSSSHFCDHDYIPYTNLVSLSSSSNSCLCSSLSRVLTL